MRKIRNGNEIINIDCDNEMCKNCQYKPNSLSDQKCKIFRVLIDHINSSSINGWKRCLECINAELKE